MIEKKYFRDYWIRLLEIVVVFFCIIFRSRDQEEYSQPSLNRTTL